jgi:hypothetical protein
VILMGIKFTLRFAAIYNKLIGRTLVFLKANLSEPVNKFHSLKTPPPSVATVSNIAVQHGPIALPNLLCTPVSVAQKLYPRNGPANA